MNIPYIGFGNDTLRNQPRLTAGEEIDCDKCSGRHTLEASTPPLLLFYRCGGKEYLAAIDGADVRKVKPDCSGNIPTPGGEG